MTAAAGECSQQGASVQFGINPIDAEDWDNWQPPKGGKRQVKEQRRG